jgi:dolichol-phosphate mannosyltransferase
LNALRLSIVIPTYNERESLPALLDRLNRTLDDRKIWYEVIVVDDDSPDGTWELAESLRSRDQKLRVIRRRGQRGLATAVVAGWSEARGDVLGVLDGDLQHPPETVGGMLDAMERYGADIVVASRSAPSGGASNWSARRRAISWFATLLALGLLPLGGVRDPLSGFFILRKDVVSEVTLKPEGYKILLEVLVRGRWRTVREVPYTFEEREKGRSKMGWPEVLAYLRHVGSLFREAKR